MPSYYDAVDVEPTYELAESIIKAIVRNLKYATDYLNDYPNLTGYIEYSLERLGYKRTTRFTGNKSDIHTAVQIIIKHFPDILTLRGNSVLIKDNAKDQLNANDLLIAEYYVLLLNEYEERIAKYQRYLKKQQDRQRNKLLLVLFLLFILFILMILVGD